MDINNSINIANQTASAVSKLNINSAIAKKSYEAPKDENDVKQDSKADDIKLMEKNTQISQKVDVGDIQKYANYMGENLSIDDINYGLMYGRSVIVDYSV